MAESDMTYISLFSSAGVGCYGFKLEGFECIATNELIQRRLNVQKVNAKCKYPSGYICGDITKDETKDSLYNEINLWKKRERLKRVDVVIATPPCQGMSVANHKKTNTEIVRNSLVVESIKIIKAIHPRFFIFENVPAFMKTVCSDIDGYDKPIADAIEYSLGSEYSYSYRVINFKNYGANSSRSRTVVIGVSKDLADDVSPFELYPDLQPERTLRDVIGDLPSLREFGKIDPNDIYHAFREYPKHMRAWISDLKEGQSAFDNADDANKPHQVIDGKIVINQRKNADKYTRQCWDKVGPCVHTRNDQLASQNTIHPSDDRVFSIRELMRMMTVPSSFKWSEESFDYLNELSLPEKKAYLRKEEIKIRQSLGEAVPTSVFQAIAHKIAAALRARPVTTSAINKIVSDYNLDSAEAIIDFITSNPLNLSLSTLSRVAELSNTRRTDNAAFYTNKTLITEMLKRLPEIDAEVIRILEPSAGVGNFIPLLIKKFEGRPLIIDLMDIDENSVKIARALLAKNGIPENCTINYIVDDFLTHKFSQRYDYVIGNPPFYKMRNTDKKLLFYRKNAINKVTTNICSFFLDKAIGLATHVALVFPKFILNTPEFTPSRYYLSEKCVECIIDFGEKGFPGVLIETIAMFIKTTARPKNTTVISLTKGIKLDQPQSYIFDSNLPYWIIYRNELFDRVCKKLDFNRFTVFRDRQLTNSLTKAKGDIRVIKSRNISDDGQEIIDIPGYDSYVDAADVQGLSVMEFLDDNHVYLTPNMTYKPRVMPKPTGVLVNGSVAILIPKDGVHLTKAQCIYYSTDEYRTFYQIARNYQTRSLNVDACSVFFYGILRDHEKRDPITEKNTENKQPMPF